MQFNGLRYSSMVTIEKVKRKLLLPPGSWQLFSFGRLSEEAVAKMAIWVWAYFRRVKVDSNGAIISWHDEVVSDRMPVAEMVIFDVGCVFQSETSRVFRSQRLCDEIVQREFEVEFTDENCRLLRRHMKMESGDFLFKNPRFPISDESNAYLLSAQSIGGMPLLIPCTTVLQTFWGRSSNLLHMLLDSRFLDFDRYVLNPQKSFLISENKEAVLWLRQWSRDEDVNFLATIAFDAQAIQRGKDIALRLHAITSEFRHSPKRCIAALPPYSDKMTLEVLGLPITTEYGEFFYVQKILKSSYKPAFNKVTHDRDNDGRRSQLRDDIPQDNARIIERESEQSIPLKEGKSTFELVSDSPGPGETKSPVRLGTFDSVFPGIANLETEKLPQLDTEFKGKLEELERAQDIRWADLLSTLPSTAVSSVEAVNTTLTSAQLVRDYPQDYKTHEVRKNLDYLVEALTQFEESERYRAGHHAEAKQNEKTQSLTVEPRFPWKPSPICGGRLLFSLPNEVNDQAFAWLYSDPDMYLRKRAACLEITMFSRHEIEVGYILDIEGRASMPRNGHQHLGKFTSTPIFFIWRRKGWMRGFEKADSRISNSEFREIIKALAVHGNLLAARTHLPEGCRVESRKHNDSLIPLDKLVATLREKMQSDDL